MKKQQVLLIHGGTTFKNDQEYLRNLREKDVKIEWLTSRRDWKNELQDHLGNEYIVYTPQMPNKQNAQYDEWVILFEKILEKLNDELIVVAHSLGAGFVTKYLSENKCKRDLKAIFLISAPFNGEGMGSEKLNSFLRKPGLGRVEEIADKLYFYHSKDDFAVPYSHFELFEKAMPNANFKKFDDRNHFLQDRIPELIRDIIELSR